MSLIEDFVRLGKGDLTHGGFFLWLKRIEECVLS
jgi:hypothetical protein